MSQRIPKALKQLIREQAVRRCEYCGVHEDDSVLTHRPDHIVARKHGGETVLVLLSTFGPFVAEFARIQMAPQSEFWRIQLQGAL